MSYTAVPISQPLTDHVGAFVAHAPLQTADVKTQGALAGLTLAVKDLFDVASFRTGAGTPDWLTAAKPAERGASVVETLLVAGAGYVGKTHTDELAWSLNGENVHYGTPLNSAAPDRIPGGSSSGSAAAVAAGLADIGLGTDTGGSIRLPSSYCGLWGLRPTHGVIPTNGLLPLAPSYDTVGWMTARAAHLAQVGRALLPARSVEPITRLIVLPHLFEEVIDHGADLLSAAQTWATATGLPVSEGKLPVPTDELREIFRVTQWAEVWDTHGGWVQGTDPTLDPAIAARFKLAETLSDHEIAEAKQARFAAAERLRDFVPGGAALLVPGAASAPPLLGTTGAALDTLRARALGLLAIAGVAGLPQIAMPALQTTVGPLGLGLIAGSGADLALLDLVGDA